MSTWYILPSAAPIQQLETCISRWHDCGYKVMVFDEQARPNSADWAISDRPYHGWPRTINLLAQVVLSLDQDCQVLVAGGDDVDPEPRVRADVIADQFLSHFGGSLGVMQPTGDVWMVDESGKGCAERVAGQPWLGREYIRRGYLGVGPFWPGFHHFYADEEIQNVATKMKIFQQRPDLSQYHHHWSRNGGKRPEHLKHAQQHWNHDKMLFETRRDNGFPQSSLLRR